MARFCVECGKKIPILEMVGRSVCSECEAKAKAAKDRLTSINKAELDAIKREIILSKKFSEQQFTLLKRHDKAEVIQLYSDLFKAFESDGELQKEELVVLQTMQKWLNLSNEDIDFESTVMPYYYAYMIKIENKLPVIDFQHEPGMSKAILKKNEIIHFATPAALVEVKKVWSTYGGGSTGVSVRVSKGVTFRIGGHRGHIWKVEKPVWTSSGYIVISNQRIFLYPFPGNKPVSIPLDKVLSYNCFEDGVEIYQEGREKGYFFGTPNKEAPELIGMCIGFLTGD